MTSTKDAARFHKQRLRTKRDQLVGLQNNLCHYCRRRFGNGVRQPTLDHVVPQALGGKDRADNLVAACLECNRAKGDLSAEAFFEVLTQLAREEAA